MNNQHQRLSLGALRTMMSQAPLNMNDAKAIAEKQAYKLLALAGCTEPGDIDQAIAGLPRLRIDTVEDLPASGAVDWTGTHWQILLNADDAPVRQRFSTAHELKHILDHPFHDAHRRTLSSSQIEAICDYFAGCLLMPRPWLKAAWTSGTQDLGELAQRFGVSRQAMKVRLDQTGIRPPESTAHVRAHFRGVFRAGSSRLPYLRTASAVRSPALAGS